MDAMLKKYRHTATNLRASDPYLDRRSSDDRRQRYSLVYFNRGGQERRSEDIERRIHNERRKGFVRISNWSSIFPAA
ncbi:MAG: hypothetical protein HKP41_11240 [Desulfobacterales bacterium]|nr:hypothetical protein [Deltaproteobacteria bacterium]MBT8362967.1 hypothetical protein [Deltaproteobacteria bacterium]NNK94914.1 hypothetical protein [Desulfobacterales bacterium]